MKEITCRRGFVPESTWLMTWQNPCGGRIENCGTIQGLREQVDVGSIQNVGIAPEHRDRGLGAALVMQSLAGFKSVGIRFVTLEVTAQNDRAWRLYKRLGFRNLRTVFKSVDVLYS
jgi:hypothetical protein